MTSKVFTSKNSQPAISPLMASWVLTSRRGSIFVPHTVARKERLDQYMLDYARAYGLRTVVFRHSTIYGGQAQAPNA